LDANTLSGGGISNSTQLNGAAGTGAVGRLAGVSEPRSRDVQSASATRSPDQVELSTEAQVLSPWLTKLKQLPAVRQDLVDQVRGQIANGSYDTPEKLDQALNSMIDETQSGQIF
jgi:negative regulator of flagellin synthesis FlgM